MELPDGVYLVRVRGGRVVWQQRLGSRWGPVIIDDGVSREIVQDFPAWAVDRGYDQLAQRIGWEGDLVTFVTRYLGYKVYYSPEKIGQQILHDVPQDLEDDEPTLPEWDVQPNGEPSHWDWLAPLLKEMVFNDQILEGRRATFQDLIEATDIVAEVAQGLIAQKLRETWGYSQEVAERVARRAVRHRKPLIFRTIAEGVQKDWTSSERFDGEDRGDGFPNRTLVWWKRTVRRGLVGRNWRPLE